MADSMPDDHDFTATELSQEDREISVTKCSLFAVFAITLVTLTLFAIYFAREKSMSVMSSNGQSRDSLGDQRNKDHKEKEGMDWHDGGSYMDNRLKRKLV
ncbi:hypothetical protein RB195_016175 [Necator americanus]|uniref:Uncharacterized protein n=1 Tax=Necator americanus TaxID=51031 RepID=A0ABR1EAI6_NECAM